MAKKQPPARKKRRTRPVRPMPDDQAATPRRRAAPPSRNERTLRRRIESFAYEQRFRTDVDRAIHLYFDQDAEQDGTLVLDEERIPAFQEWYINDYITTEGERVIDLFSRDRGPQLPAAQREMLADWQRVNRLRLLEVQKAEPGVGVTVLDLLSGEVLDVKDISSSWALQRWHVTLARPLLTEGRLRFTGTLSALSPMQKPELLQTARDMWERYQVQHPLASLDDFYRDHSLDLYHVQREIVAAPPPTPYTEEGHPIAPCTARYSVVRPQALVKRLDRAQEYFYAGPADDETALSYVWLLTGRSHVPEVAVTRGMMLKSQWVAESGEASYRSLGDVMLWGDTLELSCLSKERLEAGKALLKATAGRLLRHLGDEYRDLEDILEAAQDSPSGDIPSEIDPIVEGRIMEAQSDQWLDTPVPMLEGKSPREAARDPAAREQLDELFKIIEYAEERKRRDGEHYVDVTALRRKLGLPPLGS